MEKEALSEERIAQEYEKAVAYVRKNKSWSVEEDEEAFHKIALYRCDIRFADPNIAMEIADLMDEYGARNNLEDGWWMDDWTEDNVFFDL